MQKLFACLDGLWPSHAPGTRVLSLVGAGGKTSLLFSLAGSLHAQGHTVVSTTTTKICTPEAGQTPLLLHITGQPDWRERLLAGLACFGHVSLVEQAVLDNAKLAGISCELADSLAAQCLADYLLIEADGAARRALKAPAAHEPVVPTSTNLCLGVMGLSVVGRPLSEEWVFRSELAARCCDQDLGSPVTAQTLARLAVHPDGLFRGLPATAAPVLVLHQADIEGGLDLAARVAACARQLGARSMPMLAVSVRSGLCEPL